MCLQNIRKLQLNISKQAPDTKENNIKCESSKKI